MTNIELQILFGRPLKRLAPITNIEHNQRNHWPPNPQLWSAIKMIIVVLLVSLLTAFITDKVLKFLEKKRKTE